MPQPEGAKGVDAIIQPVHEESPAPSAKTTSVALGPHGSMLKTARRHQSAVKLLLEYGAEWLDGKESSQDSEENGSDGEEVESDGEEVESDGEEVESDGEEDE